jgi:hypothetical protein
MNAPESIIVYRNPMEQQMWEFWMDPNNLMWGFIIFVAIIVSCVIYGKIMDRYKRYNR